MKLVTVEANEEHISQLISWFANQQKLEQWGGPNMTFTTHVTDLSEQLRINEIPSFSVLNEEGQLIGFGQYYPRLDRGHLGRIGISPSYRGQGYGHVLLKELILKALGEGYKELSLFVAGDNTAALQCYQKGGFQYEVYPDQLPVGMTDIRYMVYKA